MKMEIELQEYGIVNDVPDTEFKFVCESMQVQSIKNYFGNHKEVEQFDSFFVKIGDSYEEILGMEGTVPHNDKRVWCLDWSWK